MRAYLGGFVVLGLSSSIAGPALSHLRDRVGTTDGGIASVFAVNAFGYIVGSLGGGRLVDRGNAHRWWAIALAVVIASMLVIAEAPNLFVLLVAFAVMGATGGLADVAGNTLVVWSRHGRATSLLNGLHLCFALGALATPIVVARSLDWFHSLWAVTIPTGAIAAICAVRMLTRPEPERSLPPPVPAGDRHPRARSSQLASVCVFFFLYVAMESGFAGWIHTYVEQVDPGNSATGVTVAFWAGFVLGRMIAIAVGTRISAGQIVGSSMVVALAAMVCLVAVGRTGPALWVFVVLYSMAIAPQFASMVSYAEHHLSLSGASTSLFIAASGIGGLSLPWVIGQLFDHLGAESLPPTILVVTVLAGVSALVVRSTVGQRPPVTSRKVPVT